MNDKRTFLKNLFLPKSFPSKRAYRTKAAAAILSLITTPVVASDIGQEKAIPRHISVNQASTMPLARLLEHGNLLMSAPFTIQDGAGRPLTKGTGTPLSDPNEPLIFPRNTNRISAPDANSCAGCHAQPFGVGGGDGDMVANVFVLANRFDSATFDGLDNMPTKGAMDENGNPVTLQTIANERLTLGMWGAGFIEMLARQMTRDLQAIRDSIEPGESAALVTKDVSFGRISRDSDGNWNTSGVEGLGQASLKTSGPDSPPDLIIRPFHQSGNVISLRQFTNNALNHHHGIQSAERFGDGVDADGDGFINEVSRGDVTALTLAQATMAVPGQVIPRNRAIEQAIADGEKIFEDIGCARCHRPSLPLENDGWVFSEPNPYNPEGNLQVGDAPTLQVDLTDHRLPKPRLRARSGVVYVPAFTDLKLHDITSGPDDPNREPLNMHASPGSEEFFAGNSEFLTRKLWGTGNTPPFFHHGKFTTLRESILAHAGEAEAERLTFEELSDNEKNYVIEFLKSLQILPPGTLHRIVDENYRPRPMFYSQH